MPKPVIRKKSVFTGRLVRNTSTVKNNSGKQSQLYARARSIGWSTTATKLERGADIAEAKRLEIQANQARGIRENLTLGQPSFLQGSVQRGYYRTKGVIAKTLGSFSRKRQEKNAALYFERKGLLEKAQDLREKAAGKKTLQERMASVPKSASPAVEKKAVIDKTRVRVSPRAFKLNQQTVRKAIEIGRKRKATKKIITADYRAPRETILRRIPTRFTPERASQLAEQLIRDYENNKKRLDLNPALFPKEQLELMKELLNSGLLEKVEREYLQRLISRFNR